MRLKSMFLIILLLAGCNAQPPAPPPHPHGLKHEFTDSMKADFEGEYEAECQLMYFSGLKLYGISDERFERGNNFKRWLKFFLDSDCQIPFANARQDGRFEFFEERSEHKINSGIALEYAYSWFEPETKQAATLLITQKFAGREDWQSQIWLNITKGYTIEPQEIFPELGALDALVRTECVSRESTDCTQVRLERISETQGNR